MEVVNAPLLNVSNVMIEAVIETIQSNSEFSGRFHQTEIGGICFVDLNPLCESINNEALFYTSLKNNLNQAIQNAIDFDEDEDEPLTIDDFDLDEIENVKEFISMYTKGNTIGAFKYTAIIFECI